MSLLVPGALHVPWFVPYCRLCNQPVERYAVDDVTSPYRVGVDAECCGRRQGGYVSVEEILRIKRTSDKLYLVTRKGHYQGVDGLRRRPVHREQRDQR